MSNGTPLYVIYTEFINRVTDDYLMETTLEETFENIEILFKQAIPKFRFPKFPLYDIDFETVTLLDPEDPNVILSKGKYNVDLTPEEISIIADLMLIKWFDQQLATVNITRMKYSTQDFKFTSQANHMAKLQALLKEFKAQNKADQDMYQRRTVDKLGNVKPNYEGLATSRIKGIIQ